MISALGDGVILVRGRVCWRRPAGPPGLLSDTETIGEVDWDAPASNKDVMSGVVQPSCDKKVMCR